MARKIYVKVNYVNSGTMFSPLPIPEEYLTVLQMLEQMFAWLRRGAELLIEDRNFGPAYGLIMYDYNNPEDPDCPTGYQASYYVNIGATVQNFIIRASRLHQQAGEQNTPEHNEALRLALLECTHRELTDEQRAFALGMTDDDFLAAMALALEAGQPVPELLS